MKKIRSLKPNQLYDIFKQEFIDILNRGMLFEGGLGGHLQHIYEDENLTFGDIKNIFNLASQGKLENITEKIDGQNIFFTWNAQQNQLKAARNKTDVKTGGVQTNDLAQKFSGHEKQVQDAFTSGFQILNQAFASLDREILSKIFGNGGNIWFSAEIVYPENSNVINYSNNSIVFHKPRSGQGEQSGSKANFDELIAHLEQLKQAVTNTGWQLFAPIAIQLKQPIESSFLKAALDGLQQIQTQYALTDQNSIGDLIEIRIKQDVLNQLSLSENVKDILLSRLMNKTGYDIKKIKSIIPVELHGKIDALLKNQNEIKKESIKPLETIVNVFTTEILKNIQSSLVSNSKEAIQKIKNNTDAAIQSVKLSGDQNNIDFVDQQLQKLKSTNNITSSVEGISFEYKGNDYKLTGNFSSLNKILGIHKYKNRNTVKQPGNSSKLT